MAIQVGEERSMWPGCRAMDICAGSYFPITEAYGVINETEKQALTSYFSAEALDKLTGADLNGGRKLP